MEKTGGKMSLRRGKDHQDAVEWLISLYEPGMTKTALARKAHISVNTIDACYMDINTPATKKRKLTVTLDLEPDEDRSMITISASAKSTLVPTSPVKSAFWVEADENGVPVMRETLAESPDQTIMGEVEDRAQPVIAMLNKKEG